MNLQPPQTQSSYSRPSSNGDSSAASLDENDCELDEYEYRSLEDLQGIWNDGLKYARSSCPEQLLLLQRKYVEEREYYSDQFKQEAQGDEPNSAAAEPLPELDLAVEAVAQFRANEAREKALSDNEDPVDRPANDPPRNGYSPSAASNAEVEKYASGPKGQLSCTDGEAELEPDPLGPAAPLTPEESLEEVFLSEQGCGAPSGSNSDSGLEDDLPQEPAPENPAATDPEQEDERSSDEMVAEKWEKVIREAAGVKSTLFLEQVDTEIAEQAEQERYMNKCRGLGLQNQLNKLPWRPANVCVSLLPAELQQALIDIQPLYEELVKQTGLSALERTFGTTMVYLAWDEAVEHQDLGSQCPQREYPGKTSSTTKSGRRLNQLLKIAQTKINTAELLLKIKEFRNKYKPYSLYK
ncbi:prolipoprotein diacylglyceryl transferase [Bythopirellula goksoeyrii]|uniref:Uncharacterized protein n=1 Tax=Bythopirellula goksoeyrii TaxID=1400387 RepID=A0A5B9QAP1_9BACT|nr:hypothetical protein [Bythopirellula goksoeyrii]QEG36057.1 hypothetical protein Pr1d_33660 [Bythopirellula goksoeyrii]